MYAYTHIPSHMYMCICIYAHTQRHTHTHNTHKHTYARAHTNIFTRFRKLQHNTKHCNKMQRTIICLAFKAMLDVGRL